MISGVTQISTKNKLRNRSMGTKILLQVQHDFWTETPRPKRMLLVGFHVHLKRGYYVSLRFTKKTYFLCVNLKQIQIFRTYFIGTGLT